MRVVVLVVRPRTGELDRTRSFGVVIPERIVQKLAAIVAVKGQPRKRRLLLRSLQMLVNSVMRLVPDGPALGPSALDICKGQGPREIPCHRTAAVSDCVRLEVPDPVDVLIAGADRNMFLEQ